jgi:hypothetical protein
MEREKTSSNSSMIPRGSEGSMCAGTKADGCALSRP